MTAATAIRTRGTVSVQIWNLAPPSRNSLDMHSDHDGLREETEIGYLGSEGLAIDVVAWQPPLCPGLALAIAFTSGWIDVWDFEKGLRSGYWHGSSSGRISSMSWAPWTCGLLLVSYLDGSLRLLRLDGETAEVLVDGLLTIKSAAWSSEVQGLLAFSSWDGSAGTSLSPLPHPPQPSSLFAQHPCVAFHASPTSIPFVSHKLPILFFAGKVQLLDIGRGTNGASPQILDSLDSEPGVMSWSSLPGGRLALSGADKQPNRPAVPTIMIWEVSATSWSSFNVLKGHTLEVESIAWSPADLDVLASGAFDNTISIWNVVDGTRKVLNGHSGSVTSISWSPDAKHLASAARVAEGVVRLWETNSWSNRVIEGPKWVGVGGSEGEDIRGFTTLAFAPHGDILVTGSVGTLTLTAYSSVSRGVAGWFNVLKEMHQWSNVTVTENDLRLYSLLGALEDTEVSVSETTDEARKEYCQTPSRH